MKRSRIEKVMYDAETNTYSKGEHYNAIRFVNPKNSVFYGLCGGFAIKGSDTSIQEIERLVDKLYFDFESNNQRRMRGLKPRRVCWR